MLVRFRRTMAEIGVFLLALIVLGPAVALADHQATRHFLEWDGVVGGKSLYGNRSRYTTAVPHADSTWSALGKVDVRPPNSSEFIIDFEWKDYTSSTDGYCGTSNAYTQAIWLNTWYMDPASDWNEKACTAHELGHQLAIGDHGAGYSTALMYGHVGRYISPQQHDKDDYYAKWR